MAGHPAFHFVLTDRRFESRRDGRSRSPFAPADWLQAHRPNVVLLGAFVGMIVGLLIWGYLTMSVIAGIDSLLGETEPRATMANSGTQVFDCASFGAVRALSAEDEAKYQAQCGPTTASMPEVPASAPAAPAPVPQVSAATANNRASCDEIRGTDYLSTEERTWYLSNCITP